MSIATNLTRDLLVESPKYRVPPLPTSQPETCLDGISETDLVNPVHPKNRARFRATRRVGVVVVVS